MSNETEKTDEQAFKDFKGALSVKEFETIYRICEDKYNNLSSILEGRTKFVQKIIDQLDKTNEQVENIPDEKKKDALRGIERLMKAVGRKGDKKMWEDLKEDILGAHHLTEFLNRFSAKSNTYEDLDFSFLKEIAAKDEI